MTQTMSMIGSKKFADVQAFPFDPHDFERLKLGARSDAINIYLRLFFEGDFRSIVLIDTVPKLGQLWRDVEKTFAFDETKVCDSIFRGFVIAPDKENIDLAKAGTKLLCMKHLPDLRSLQRPPRENIVGVILQFKYTKLFEYCYCRFSLDDVPAMAAKLH